MLCKVLVADDSMTVRRLLVRELRALGVAEVVEAADGDDALSALNGGAFNLVLMDSNLPRGAGLATVRELRRRGFEMPVVIVTAAADKPRIIDAFQHGGDDFLIKPFTRESLAAKVARFAATDGAATRVTVAPSPAWTCGPARCSA